MQHDHLGEGADAYCCSKMTEYCLNLLILGLTWMSDLNVLSSIELISYNVEPALSRGMSQTYFAPMHQVWIKCGRIQKVANLYWRPPALSDVWSQRPACGYQGKFAQALWHRRPEVDETAVFGSHPGGKCQRSRLQSCTLSSHAPNTDTPLLTVTVTEYLFVKKSFGFVSSPMRWYHSEKRSKGQSNDDVEDTV